MDMTMTLFRTEKGQNEIFNNGHTLRPKQRQLLFSVGNGTTLKELCDKHPTCVELRDMVQDLLQNGFIHTTASTVAQPALTTITTVTTTITGVRDHVLQTMAALVGTKSPAYRHMSEVTTLDEFRAQFPACRKVIAAVASPHQAAELEAEVNRRIGQ